jgi:hypothetical protein
MDAQSNELRPGQIVFGSPMSQAAKDVIAKRLRIGRRAFRARGPLGVSAETGRDRSIGGSEGEPCVANDVGNSVIQRGIPTVRSVPGLRSGVVLSEVSPGDKGVEKSPGVWVLMDLQDTDVQRELSQLLRKGKSPRPASIAAARAGVRRARHN